MSSSSAVGECVQRTRHLVALVGTECTDAIGQEGAADRLQVVERREHSTASPCPGPSATSVGMSWTVRVTGATTIHVRTEPLPSSSRRVQAGVCPALLPTRSHPESVSPSPGFLGDHARGRVVRPPDLVLRLRLFPIAGNDPGTDQVASMAVDELLKRDPHRLRTARHDARGHSASTAAASRPRRGSLIAPCTEHSGLHCINDPPERSANEQPGRTTWCFLTVLLASDPVGRCGSAQSTFAVRHRVIRGTTQKRRSERHDDEEQPSNQRPKSPCCGTGEAKSSTHQRSCAEPPSAP